MSFLNFRAIILELNFKIFKFRVMTKKELSKK